LWVVQKDFAEKNPQSVEKYILLLKKVKKKIGLSNLNIISNIISKKLPINFEEGESYYNKLNYDLGEIHLKSLEKFYESFFHEKIISNSVKLNFY
jgi:chorismate dehydratase